MVWHKLMRLLGRPAGRIPNRAAYSSDAREEGFVVAYNLKSDLAIELADALATATDTSPIVAQYLRSA